MERDLALHPERELAHHVRRSSAVVAGYLTGENPIRLGTSSNQLRSPLPNANNKETNIPKDNHQENLLKVPAEAARVRS